jgi:branched-chain amino acid transport system ATP-binding protein
MSALLELKDVHAGYEAGPVLHGISLSVREGEVVGLLGRNGMGKSTTLKSVLGLVHVLTGSIRFEGREISRWPAYDIPRLGIGYVPQGRRVFPELSVRENLLVGLSARRDRVRAHSQLEGVLKTFPQLEERLDQRAGTLSGGEQQMLAIARALLREPKLMLLDEPTEGLMPALVARTEQLIAEMKAQGLGVLLAEQRLETALRVCDHLYVLEKGHVVWEGSTAEATYDVLKRHLGLGETQAR